MLAATAVAAALAAFTPVVVHDASESSPLASAAPSRRFARRSDRAPAAYGRAVPPATAAPGCSTGSSTATRTRTAGSSAPAATRATGSSSSTGSPPRAARSRRSTRSTPAPSAAGSARFRCAAGARSCSPPTARTRPTCKRAPAIGCGPTPTTRPTAAAWSSRRGWSRSRALSPAWMRYPAALGRLARRSAGPARAGLAAAARRSSRDRWDAAAFAASAGSCRAACNEVGECDGRETALRSRDPRSRFSPASGATAGAVVSKTPHRADLLTPLRSRPPTHRDRAATPPPDTGTPSASAPAPRTDTRSARRSARTDTCTRTAHPTPPAPSPPAPAAASRRSAHRSSPTPAASPAPRAPARRTSAPSRCARAFRDVLSVTPALTRTVTATRPRGADTLTSTTRLGPRRAVYENRPFASVRTAAPGFALLATPIARSVTVSGASATGAPAASVNTPSTAASLPEPQRPLAPPATSRRTTPVQRADEAPATGCRRIAELTVGRGFDEISTSAPLDRERQPARRASRCRPRRSTATRSIVAAVGHAPRYRTRARRHAVERARHRVDVRRAARRLRRPAGRCNLDCRPRASATPTDAPRRDPTPRSRPRLVDRPTRGSSRRSNRGARSSSSVIRADWISDGSAAGSVRQTDSGRRTGRPTQQRT